MNNSVDFSNFDPEEVLANLDKNERYWLEWYKSVCANCQCAWSCIGCMFDDEAKKHLSNEAQLLM